MNATERDAGCRLFDKLGKKVVLTQAVEQWLHQAIRILEEMKMRAALAPRVPAHPAGSVA